MPSPAAEAETNVAPRGSTSVSTTPVATELELLLVTVTVYVSFVPAITGDAEGEIVTPRSAESVAPAATMHGATGENSEVFPDGSVAVAVTSCPLGMGAATPKLMFTWPAALVVTVVEPR